MDPLDTAERDPLIGTQIDGRYSLVRVLGQGGMGVVYEGVHDELGRSVAIKVLDAAWASDRTSVERFLREARTASSFTHGNIVDVTDVGRLPDGRPYLVMPKISGVDVATLMAEAGAQPARRVALLLSGVAGALDVVHARGFVHRDIKPENLMYVRREDGSETLMLLDFGIASALISSEPRLTQPGSIAGTPPYLPPEVCGGKRADARADVYALAVVAFEWIAGSLPFAFDDVAVLLSTKMRRHPPSMSAASGREFSPELERAIARGIARDPSQRFAHAGAFVSALRDATEKLPPASATPVRDLAATASAALWIAQAPTMRSKPPLRAFERRGTIAVGAVRETVEEGFARERSHQRFAPTTLEEGFARFRSAQHGTLDARARVIASAPLSRPWSTCARAFRNAARTPTAELIVHSLRLRALPLFALALLLQLRAADPRAPAGESRAAASAAAAMPPPMAAGAAVALAVEQPPARRARPTTLATAALTPAQLPLPSQGPPLTAAATIATPRPLPSPGSTLMAADGAGPRPLPSPGSTLTAAEDAVPNAAPRPLPSPGSQVATTVTAATILVRSRTQDSPPKARDTASAAAPPRPQIQGALTAALVAAPPTDRARPPSHASRLAATGPAAPVPDPPRSSPARGPQPTAAIAASPMTTVRSPLSSHSSQPTATGAAARDGSMPRAAATTAKAPPPVRSASQPSAAAAARAPAAQVPLEARSAAAHTEARSAAAHAEARSAAADAGPRAAASPHRGADAPLARAGTANRSDTPAQREQAPVRVSADVHAMQFTRAALSSLLDGETQRAVELARSAVAADASYAQGWRALGLALERERSARAAADAYRRFLRLESDGPTADLIRQRLATLGQ